MSGARAMPPAHAACFARVQAWPEADCVALFRAVRWPEGVVRCPRCERPDQVRPLTTQRLGLLEVYKCLGCLYHFSDVTGTVWSGRHTAMRQWFVVLVAMRLGRLTAPGLTPAALRRLLAVVEPSRLAAALAEAIWQRLEAEDGAKREGHTHREGRHGEGDRGGVDAKFRGAVAAARGGTVEPGGAQRGALSQPARAAHGGAHPRAR